MSDERATSRSTKRRRYKRHRWGFQSMATLICHNGERTLIVVLAVKPFPPCEATVTALETATKYGADGNTGPNVDGVFGDHAHQNIGTFFGVGAVEEAQDAGEAYAEAWWDGIEAAKACACGPIVVDEVAR